MESTSKPNAIRRRDIYYYRQRLKNRVFAKLAAFFAQEADKKGITRKDIADRLGRDPSQITRWLSGPSNLTLETLSDLLLALDAEPEPPQIVLFSERTTSNYAHPLIAQFAGVDVYQPNVVGGQSSLKSSSGDVYLREVTSTYRSTAAHQ